MIALEQSLDRIIAGYKVKREQKAAKIPEKAQGQDIYVPLLCRSST
jgi:hypothetical protein